MVDLQNLLALCNLPTAPYCEGHVAAWIQRWAGQWDGKVHCRQDRAGNLYLTYRHGRAPRVPLVWEGHMDHPGFVVTGQKRNGSILAQFRGGVKPSHFAGGGGARVQFWKEPGGWVKTRVVSVKTVRNARHLNVVLEAPRQGQRIPVGTLGMWDLPDARHRNGLFAARVCDDLAGVAAMLNAMQELVEQNATAHVVALCSRAEEVGFAGVLAVCENGWLPRGSPVIGIETSRAFPEAPQGAGPIIRVGDRTGIFSAGLTHFLSQTAGHLADDDASFVWQRKLMDGGTCNSTAFAAYGYDAAGVCLALGNYHNMFDRSFNGAHAPFRPPVAKAGPGIASETIHLGDFRGLVRLLVAAARRIGEYRPGLGVVRARLSKMYRSEQRQMLFRKGAI